MALVKNAARNGAVCYHHVSKEIFVLLCLFLPQGPTLYGYTLPAGSNRHSNADKVRLPGPAPAGYT